jgi:flagellar P-ring protein precursor FlgI
MRRLAFLSILFCIASSASAVKVGDITRLSGERSNVLTGLGLIVGLRGTGDGGDFAPAIRPLAAMLGKFNDRAEIRELTNVANVALVSVTAVLPPRTVRNGDKIDVYVSSLGAATSLKGGRLLIMPLQGPTPDSGIFAMAQGATVLEDPTIPTHALIPGGAVMEADLPAQVIQKGRLTLILNEPAASWTTASTIAKIINDAEGTGETLAIAVDSKNVVVSLPANERDNPAGFISRVQRLPVPVLPTEARVEINEKTGTIIMTGDVEISPVVISHKGLTITTINPAPTPTPRTPVINEKRIVPLDTTREGGAKLQELVDAMDMIRVPAEDRITIVKELYKTGKLHAKLMIAGQNE